MKTTNLMDELKPAFQDIIDSTMLNDEASSDEQLLDYFRENGVPDLDAKLAVANRQRYLTSMFFSIYHYTFQITGYSPDPGKGFFFETKAVWLDDNNYESLEQAKEMEVSNFLFDHPETIVTAVIDLPLNTFLFGKPITI
jgi:hypothetical protein